MNSASAPRISVTQLLARIDAGDDSAKQELFDQVYSELRAMAQDMMRRELKQHTLQPTALVHEAAVRLLKGDSLPGIKCRSYFFGAMAQAMRQVLVSHARSRSRVKRGGNYRRVPLDDAVDDVQQRHNLDLVALDEAMNDLQRHSRRHNEIVTLRFFGGFSINDIAEQLGVSESTVSKDLKFARAWLGRKLGAAT